MDNLVRRVQRAGRRVQRRICFSGPKSDIPDLSIHGRALQHRECPFGNNAVLAANAQNLPEVLNVLQANTAKFQVFNDLVREFFSRSSTYPCALSLRTGPSDHLAARPRNAERRCSCPPDSVWFRRRPDSCDLYVVMTSVHPQVIIIDEPQNFLHPGAVRKLIEVLKRYRSINIFLRPTRQR